jgi:hypothetical protein
MGGENGVNLLVGSDLDAHIDAAKLGRIEPDLEALRTSIGTLDDAVVTDRQ